uniref:Bifunctional inhibitor/plant lipid transfer protein/seed storage helical domain-containing protein n=1 Tax=Zea mays TaxID=4577 RepID=A0A804M5E9_MAIZE
MAAAYRHVATRGLALALAAAVVTAWQCAAQRAPSGPGCMPELVSLNPCMDYMSGNATAPDGPCCSAVSGMLRASPSCLCMVVGGTAATLGVAVDGDRALRLPAACQVQAPPANQCDVAGAPVPSPVAGTNTPGAQAAAAPSDANNVTPAGAPLAGLDRPFHPPTETTADLERPSSSPLRHWRCYIVSETREFSRVHRLIVDEPFVFTCWCLSHRQD